MAEKTTTELHAEIAKEMARVSVPSEFPAKKANLVSSQDKLATIHMLYDALSNIMEDPRCSIPSSLKIDARQALAGMSGLGLTEDSTGMECPTCGALDLFQHG